MLIVISAFVIINCHFPFDTKILNEITKLPSVASVNRTEGRYDLIIKVNAETEESLKELISNDINTIPGIDSTLLLTIA
jgi:DNA-binding Lrp family transcriptional regulator